MTDMIIPDTLPLEPCPFCGGKGHIVKTGKEYAPCCMNAYFSGERTAVCYLAPRFPAFPTYEEAAEAWNSRSDNNKHGHWEICSDGYYPYCSECKSEPESGKMTHFCPNCGADMRDENE